MARRYEFYVRVAKTREPKIHIFLAKTREGNRKLGGWRFLNISPFVYFVLSLCQVSFSWFYFTVNLTSLSFAICKRLAAVQWREMTSSTSSLVRVWKIRHYGPGYSFV